MQSRSVSGWMDVDWSKCIPKSKTTMELSTLNVVWVLMFVLFDTLICSTF